jgi:hypothetical protein
VTGVQNAGSAGSAAWAVDSPGEDSVRVPKLVVQKKRILISG